MNKKYIKELSEQLVDKAFEVIDEYIRESELPDNCFYEDKEGEVRLKEDLRQKINEQIVRIIIKDSGLKLSLRKE